MKMLNNLRFLLFGLAFGCSMDVCAIIGAGGKHPLPFAVVVCIAILLLVVNEVYQDAQRRKERLERMLREYTAPSDSTIHLPEIRRTN